MLLFVAQSFLFFFFLPLSKNDAKPLGVQLPPSIHADCTWTYNWYAFILPLLSLLPFPSSPLTTISSKIPREAVSSALLRQWARLTESMIWRLTTYPRLEHSEKQWREEIISWSQRYANWTRTQKRERGLHLKPIRQLDSFKLGRARSKLCLFSFPVTSPSHTSAHLLSRSLWHMVCLVANNLAAITWSCTVPEW